MQYSAQVLIKQFYFKNKAKKIYQKICIHMEIKNSAHGRLQCHAYMDRAASMLFDYDVLI